MSLCAKNHENKSLSNISLEIQVHVHVLTNVTDLSLLFTVLIVL